ncbi:nucleotidyltransferase and HEPN domain-containing protein (plasmid) [Rhizobium sp. CB3171]|uniref:nucleotidyltransferase and HEPN domain-containing protein n=1 Tax=Rhizobium sp. CB3171 TaxID=3039157 RepID=UPI0024B1DB59|nr:nucleotidyltransferase and HEPN domain-containing protein [Rhizobium sp. CB3171]WFU05967.1 nucleotidyltransferase and HEPN domain-containing protein [Rhizobium sp. CB3171]
MKSSLDHLPTRKQRELSHIVEILHEEFEDALKGGTADFKKKGRILKIILFGSYARGDWVDEVHTSKGYKSDYDLLIIVNNRKLTDFALFWHKAATRFPYDRVIKTPVSLIVHSRREVNTALKEGNYFFSDIRRDGIILFELDDEELAESKPLSAADEYRAASEHFRIRSPGASNFLRLSKMALETNLLRETAFLLHQAIEQAYSTLLLTLTRYSPASHLNHLRTLAEGRDRRLTTIWPNDRQRYIAWFNTINQAYAKARYSPHFLMGDEALIWLSERTSGLQHLVKTICEEHLDKLRKNASARSAH